jgi:fluoroacetyl-CoA thioesterase
MPEIGTTHERTWIVGPQHLASAFGSGLVDVLATPVLVGFCEETSREMVDPELPPGRKTVGTVVHIEHLAATPVGLRVRVRATLTAIEGRRLSFAIEADDGIETIARASHQRFIIDADRFASRVAEKSRAASETAEA